MDINLEDFYQRIARVEAAHARGYGFEARGTVGRSHYRRRSRPGMSIIKPLLVTFLCVTGLKAALLNEIGTEVYAARVAELTAGQGVDRIGGYLMSADPVTLWAADKLTNYLPRL